MSDYIKRDKAIEAIAEHLMGEAVLEYPDASDNIEDWKEIGEAILESVPPAEVIPKGSDEASLAYAEGWKNGEEAERSRHKIAMSDLIKRKSIRNMYSCLNPNDRVLVGQVLIDIDAIPSADVPTTMTEVIDAIRGAEYRGYMKGVLVGGEERPKGEWADALAELHERFDALEKEIRRASAEMSAVIREYVDRPKGEWIDAEIPLESGDTMPIQVCNLCKTFYPLAYTGGGHRFCPQCGARMKGADDE